MIHHRALTPKQHIFNNIIRYAYDQQGHATEVLISDLDPENTERSACVLKIPGDTVVQTQFFDSTVPEIILTYQLNVDDVDKCIAKLRLSGNLEKKIEEFLLARDDHPVDTESNFRHDCEVKSWLPVLAKYTKYFVAVYHDTIKNSLMLCVHVGMIKASDVIVDKIFNEDKRSRTPDEKTVIRDFVADEHFDKLNNLIIRYASCIAFFTCAILKITPQTVVQDEMAVENTNFEVTLMVRHDDQMVHNLNVPVMHDRHVLYTSRCALKSINTDEVYFQTVDPSESMTAYMLSESECESIGQSSCVSIPFKTSESQPVLITIDGSRAIFDNDISEKNTMPAVFYVSRK